MKKAIAITLAALCLILAGCGTTSTNAPAQTAAPTAATGNAAETLAVSAEDMFTKRDLNADWTEDGSVCIELNGETAAASGEGVTISGGVITLTVAGCYIVSGTLTEGMLIVDAAQDAKLQIVLRGASISSAGSAALYVKSADKVVVTLADGTENALANGGGFEAVDENNIDGAVFSKEDISINGAGALRISSPAGHGIVCKDDLVLAGGEIEIEAASHAVDANDSVRVRGVSLSASAGKDGIHAENKDDAALGFVYIEGGSFTIDAEGDGISAASKLQVLGGEFEIRAGGGSENGAKQSSGGYGSFPGARHGGMGGNRPGAPGENRQSGGEAAIGSDAASMKGLKAGTELIISGGSFKINAADDALHSNGDMSVTGGAFELETGDDGLHADESLEVSGGELRISESYEGIEALHLTISGGDITINASDDGLNAAGGRDSSGFGGRGGMAQSGGSIVISGGSVSITASGDGIDANGTLEITGGYITVCGPVQGDTATLDYDVAATITGGTFIGTGAYGMAQTFSDSTQGVFAVSVGSQSAGTRIELRDADGGVVITHTPALPYAVVILSSPELIKGETYSITIGNQTAEFEAR